MSEQLNHRLINFEIAPPATVWDSISQRLDDDDRYAVLSHKLENFETAAPDAAWSNITERIQDDKQYTNIAGKFKDYEVSPPSEVWDSINTHLKEEAQESASFIPRMQYFEAEPPQFAWKNISDVLQEDEKLQQLSERLNNFSAVPPSNSWQNIANTLSEQETATAPVVKLNRPFYKISAAAVLVGLLIGGWFLVNRNSVKTELAKNPTVPAANTNEDANNATPAKPMEDIKQQEQTVAVEKAATTHGSIRNNVATNNVTTYKEELHALKHADINDLVAYQRAPINITSAPILDNNGNVIRDMDVLTAHSYVTVTGPNGQQTRISSKFANIVRFLDENGNNGTQEYLDRVIVESDHWKKLFQEWRNKIRQSSYIPSSSNFLDIIEFKDLIQEKQ